MLIYLNGTSSSGKTSIALQLRELSAKSYFYFSIDTLLYSLPKQDLEAIMGRRAYRQKLDWTAIFDGYLASIGALVKAGNFVIADCPISNEMLAESFERNLPSTLPKVVVKIECPLEILVSRERSRGDRAEGVAARQFPTIHNFLRYDVAYESHSRAPAEIAEDLLLRLKDR